MDEQKEVKWISLGKVSDVKVKVVFTKGICSNGHKVGQEWTIGRTTPAGICLIAYNSIFPNIRLLQRGGRHQYPAGSGVIRAACPDAWNQVVFELSAVPGVERQLPPLPETCGHLEYL